MARKTYEELSAIIKSAGVSRGWSWSRWNCFCTSPYEYFLKYIDKVKPDRDDCIYTTTGGIVHDILEKYYTHNISYNDMIDMFEDAWMTAFDIAQLKFDRNNEEKNEQIAHRYYEDLENFFMHHVPINENVVVEQFVKAMIGGNFFHGYIDACFKDGENNIHIVDWKTSSIYKGKKAENECGQLIVYAIGLHQQGIPFDKIRICWNFLKYVSVQVQQANGSVKTREIERCEIGSQLQNNARMWLKKLGYDDVDNYLKMLLDTNSIEVLPDDVQAKYKINDCYVYIPITEKLIDKWTNKITTVIEDIVSREEYYNETKNEKTFWDTEDSMKAQSYYFATLCEYSPYKHKPYKKYLDELGESQKEKDKLYMNMGGKKTGSVNGPTINISKPNAADDYSWLDNI